MTDKNKNSGCDRCGGPLFVAEAGPEHEDLCRPCYLGYDYIIMIDPARQRVQNEPEPDASLDRKRCRIRYELGSGDVVEVQVLDGDYYQFSRRYLIKVQGNTSA